MHIEDSHKRKNMQNIIQKASQKLTSWPKLFFLLMNNIIIVATIYIIHYSVPKLQTDFA